MRKYQSLYGVGSIYGKEFQEMHYKLHDRRANGDVLKCLVILVVA